MKRINVAGRKADRKYIAKLRRMSLDELVRHCVAQYSVSR
jgi:hypothetical protein